MRNIEVNLIRDKIVEMVFDANHNLGNDVSDRIEKAKEEETFPLAKNILEDIEKNIEISKEGIFPLCQDTGMAVVFCEIGQDVHLVGGNLEDAINEGIRIGYRDFYLRKSVVKDPLRRVNTGDNTPAHIIYKIVSGDKVKLVFAPKGFGSENMSKIKMLTVSDGVEGVKDFVLDVVRQGGGNPCPPIVVGVGIGGTFDKCAMMAKEALTLPLDEENQDPYYADLERELLEKINSLGIGPQGFGGKNTALAVKIKTFPTHIAGLPVAVNINCHVARHIEVII